ncbi:hypothetical protein [Sphingomonas sp. PB4P5]|uniref:hypothetical protein n=1 Tax=Parasphingomonas puruogangriensis TaxID=3096155 RepID=UPI002FC91AA3
MVMGRSSASLISVRELPGIVEAAVKAAGVRVEGESLVLRWDLAGKVVRDFGEGKKFADAVAKQVTEAGFEASPAVLQIDDRILAGFFERIDIPQFRNF